MAITTSKALQWTPAAAGGASVTPSGTAWANSAWIQLIASTSGAIQIEQVAVNPNIGVEFEIDIGKGAAGSEVAVATFRAQAERITSGPDGVALIGLVVDAIPNASRVSYRLRKSGTNTSVWTVALGYYNQTDSTNTTIKAQQTLPSAGDGLSLTPPGTAWGNSAWVQLTAGLSNAMWFAGFDFIEGVTGVDFEFEVGTGVSGSEAVATTVRGRCDSNRNVTQIILPQSLQIGGGTRIALRMRLSSTSVAAWTVGTVYYLQEDFSDIIMARSLMSQP